MRRWLLVLCAVTALMGCGYERLYSDLDEQQANEMLALLLREDIDARKAQVEKAWALETVLEDLPLAMQKLKENGYPRATYESLGDVFKKEGFVSSPLEERARLLHGLSQELSQTVSNIDGVIVARVHLAIPEHNALSDQRKPSSASVFIKHRPDSKVARQTASIKALVVNSVEGLPYDHVTVTFFPTDAAVTSPQAASVAGWQFEWPDTVDWSDKRLLVGGAVAAVLLILLVCWALRAARKRPRPPRLVKELS